MTKNLILYYSRAGENYWDGKMKVLRKGNTEIVAEFIQKAVGGDAFLIEPVREYDFGYKKCVEQAKADFMTHARPELKKYLDCIDEYDVIFVCGPCWCGTFPTCIFSQLERLDWTGKKVIPVVTHEGSGFGTVQRDLEETCKGANLGEGLAVKGSKAADSEKLITVWANEIFK